jgi:hypothetical protein
MRRSVRILCTAILAALALAVPVGGAAFASTGPGQQSTVTHLRAATGASLDSSEGIRATANECHATQGTDYNSKSKVITAFGYTYDCVGAVLCTQQTDLQMLNRDKDWKTIRAAAIEFGCGRSYASITSEYCAKAAGNLYFYRASTIYVIIWDNEVITGPLTYNSPRRGIKRLC